MSLPHSTSSIIVSGVIDDELHMLRQDFWDQRYASRAQIWSGRPNPHLVARIADLAPATRLTWAAARAPTQSGSPGGAGR